MLPFFLKCLTQKKTPNFFWTADRSGDVHLSEKRYGPYFAFVATNEDSSQSAGLAYFMPVLFSLLLVSLDQIQAYLENPFDQVGEDDIVINAEKFLRTLVDIDGEVESAGFWKAAWTESMLMGVKPIQLRFERLKLESDTLLIKRS